ncbi:biopolymer transport protein ExbD [mine drainage metagenome]|uniref:Biopolymer transport protein ExbD n=1 Tax=mine drainage metagenome TaxID=410659 RepID=A0A1J5QZ37_9ZZZZ
MAGPVARGRRPRRLMNQINVVPYIDVTLVLLVIFMITAPMTNPGVVELPQVGEALKQMEAPLVITVKTDKTTGLDGKDLPRDQLLAAVRASLDKHPGQAVVISADKSARYEDVIGVMDLLKQNKVEKVGLLLNPAK